MERQMEKNRLMGPHEQKENEILRAGNKKSWMSPRLVKIDTSRSTEAGTGVTEDDGPSYLDS